MKPTFTFFLLLLTILGFSQPSNDECYTATAIILNNGYGGASGTTVNATESNNPAIYPDACLTSLLPINDVWFTFNTGPLTDYRVRVEFDAASGVSPAFDLMRGACGTPPVPTFLLSVGCVNNSPTASNFTEYTYTGLDPNTDYYIRITGYGGTGGSVIDTVTVSPYCPPIVLDNSTNGGTSTSCSCGMTDSGGPTGNYSPSENYTYMIAPSDPHTCIDLFFTSYKFEPFPALDKLEIYFGNTVDPDSLFKEICGQGTNTLVAVPTTGAITVRMRSDGTLQDEGFEMEWTCSNACPPSLPASNCTQNTPISSLPFTQTALSTCGAGNDYNDQDACGSFYMNGEDYVFTYTSPGNECINVDLAGTSTNAGVFILDGCPDDPLAQCIASQESPSGNPTILSLQLDNPGTYYIVVSTEPGNCGTECTSFDIIVQNSVCPLDITSFLPVDSLIETIASQGAIVQTPVLTCPNGASGTFTGGISDGTNMIEGGIVLSTGFADGIEGPNLGTFWSSNSFGAPGDSALSAIANDLTFDACILEFDLYATTDKLDFDYIFMSEEYNEYVGTTFNDVFAFLISGPGILNGTNELNLAYLPGTTTPISINTVNDSLNSQYFVNNDDPSGLNWNTIEYDGHTTVLTAETNVIPCNWYHIRLAIADVFDDAFDSGVLIAANSFGSGIATISSTSDSAGVNGTINAAEACANGQFQVQLFTLPPSGDSTVIILEQSNAPNQATEGVDFGFIPDSLVFYNNVLYAYYPNGIDTVTGGVLEYTIPIVPVADGINELAEPFTIVLLSGCGIPEPYDSATIVIRDELSATLPSTILICGEPVPMPISGTGIDFATWNTSVGLSDSTIVQPIITAFESINYTVVVSNGICTDTLSTSVVPYVVNVTGDDTFCEGGSTQAVTQANSQGYTYNWQPSTGLSCTDCPNPVIAPPIGNYTYLQIFTSADGVCTDTNYVYVDVLAQPSVNLGDDISICEGETVELSVVDEGLSYAWFQDENPFANDVTSINVSPLTTTTYSLLADNGYCDTSDDIVVNVGGTFDVTSIPSETEVVLGQSVTTSTTVTETSTSPIGNLTYGWSPANGLSCSDCAEPVITPTETTTYTLTITSASGCEESVNFTIVVNTPNFAVPNLFSPNGDNRNDRFSILSATDFYEIEKFDVFDRWGNVVFTTTSDQSGWDGTFNGKDMPQDTYVFNIVIRLVDGTTQTFNGEVLLVR